MDLHNLHDQSNAGSALFMLGITKCCSLSVGVARSGAFQGWIYFGHAWCLPMLASLPPFCSCGGKDPASLTKWPLPCEPLSPSSRSGGGWGYPPLAAPFSQVPFTCCSEGFPLLSKTRVFFLRENSAELLLSPSHPNEFNACRATGPVFWRMQIKKWPVPETSAANGGVLITGRQALLIGGVLMAASLD